MKEMGYKNPHQVPRLVKIVLNSGIGKDNKDAKILESVQKDIAQITGQKPVITRARKSIAGFNLRKGDICGIMVTLRDNKMYEFIDRLITVALPRVRDFDGLPANSKNNKGSYTIGIKEQVIFPEIDYNTVYKIKGFNISIVTTAKTAKETIVFLRQMGFPIRED